MVGNNNLEKKIYHLNRRERKQRGGGGRLSVSALCHGVINIQFSSGAASLHTLTLLQVAVFERFLHKSAEWIWSSHNSSMLQLACKQESCLWYACECTGCLPGADLWCLFVCVCVCLCAHVHKASVHNVHKAVFTHSLHVCECVPCRQSAYAWSRVCPKYYSSKSLKRDHFSDTFPTWHDMSWDPVLLVGRQIAAAPLPIIPLSLSPAVYYRMYSRMHSAALVKKSIC